jgi:glucose/arabinose dehydrogenase
MTLTCCRRSIGAALRLAAVVALCWPVLSGTAATGLPPGFFDVPVASGLSNPTAMAFAPDGRLFVTQQGGQLRVIKNGALLATPFVSLTVSSVGERGLLGVAFDPGFATNQFVYVFYTATTPSIHNRISRFRANGDVADPAHGEVTILDFENLSATNHNGGAIHVGPDGKLYAAHGENAVASNAQSLNNKLGKILRMNTNPAALVPADNPFVNQTTGNNRLIWALGLRNPFTFAFQPGTGRIFINDVGAGSWEEINDGQAGRNFGWPTTEGPDPPGLPQFVYPIYAYRHSGATPSGCAVAGGAFYNPPTPIFPASYVGKYFFADLCSGWIYYINPANPAVATQFALSIAAPVDLKVGPDGALYYLARGAGMVGKITAGNPLTAPANLRIVR